MNPPMCKAAAETDSFNEEGHQVCCLKCGEQSHLPADQACTVWKWKRQRKSIAQKSKVLLRIAGKRLNGAKKGIKNELQMFFGV